MTLETIFASWRGFSLKSDANNEKQWQKVINSPFRLARAWGMSYVRVILGYK